MPTLDEAARALRISEKTLRRWLTKVDPPITPVKHPLDGRYHVITDDELARVAALRAEMPGKAAIIPSYSPLAFDRRQSVEGMSRRPAVPRATDALATSNARSAPADGLPEGWMSRTVCAELHHFPHTTLIRWCERGLVETSPETFGGGSGQFPVSKPLTAAGLAQFYALAHLRPDFVACPGCPHNAS